MKQIPPAALSAAVAGVNLQPGTLRDQLGDQPTLLVFLRHFGCPLCREMVGDLRNVASADAAYPPVLFVYQGTAEDGADFFGKLWPEARAVADPSRLLYRAFGVARGGLGELYGPGAAACYLRAATKGNLPGRTIGDPSMMPGLFLVEGDAIVWRHTFRNAGDHPDFASLPLAAGR